MPRRIRLPPLLLFLSILSLAFLPGASDPSRLSYYSLGVQEGLAGASVNCIVQDAHGLLWFGGEGGLSRFDGHSFTTFRPGSGPAFLGLPAVTALVEEAAGTLLVGTEGAGLFRFDPRDGVFQACGAAGGRREPRLDRILALAGDRRGRSFAGTTDGFLFRIEGTPDCLPIDLPGLGRAPVTGLRVDGKGRLWVATDGEGLFLLDESGSSLGHWRHSPGDESSLGDDRITSLFEDSLGGLWLGFASGGVDLRVEGGFRHARLPSGRTTGLPLRCLAEDSEGRIWVGSAEGGIGVLDSSSLLLSPASREGGLRLRALLRDSRGLMWAGLAEGGVRCYNPASSLVSSWPGAGGGGGGTAIRGLIGLGPSQVVVARAGGLEVLDSASGGPRPLSLPAGTGKGGVGTILAGKDGTLWIGTEDGVLLGLRADGRILRLEPGSGGEKGLGALSPLYEDPDGSLWLGIEGRGIDRYDPRRGQVEHFRPGPGRAAPGLHPRRILRDGRGRLWAGSADSGLSLFDLERGAFVDLGAGAGPGGSVTSLLEDEAGNLWIGTSGAGLWRLEREADRPLPFAGPEGLLGDSIHDLARTREGLLWFATDRGLVSRDPRVGTFFLFGVEDGLPPGVEDGARLLPGEDGRLWIATSGGLGAFDPAAMPRYATQPDVVLAGVESTGGPPPRRSPDGSEVVLGHDNGGLTFRVAVTDYVAPFRNRYAFKLEGWQAGWTSLGGDNAGHLAALPPGRYMLRVRGSNGNGVWNDYGAALAVTVRPPLWGTWWFRSALALVFLSILGLAIAARIGALRGRNRLLVAFARHVEEAREEERKTAAREVHDEIGQDLMVLNLHAYWLSTHAEASLGERRARLALVQAAVLDAMASVKAVATRLRPEALDALDFPDALRWHLAGLRRAGDLEIEEEIDDGARGLDSDRAAALYRVLQEMLGNVIRHARAKKVRVGLSVEGEELRLEVSDDGIGMEKGKAEARDSFGLIGMRERCAGLGGTLEIGSAEGRGTRVVARLPLRPPAPPRRPGRS